MGERLLIEAYSESTSVLVSIVRRHIPHHHGPENLSLAHHVPVHPSPLPIAVARCSLPAALQLDECECQSEESTNRRGPHRSRSAVPVQQVPRLLHLSPRSRSQNSRSPSCCSPIPVPRSLRPSSSRDVNVEYRMSNIKSGVDESTRTPSLATSVDS